MDPMGIPLPDVREAKFVKTSEAVNMDVAAFKSLQAGCLRPHDIDLTPKRS